MLRLLRRRVVPNPDYGLYLLRLGYPTKVSHFFYSFPVDHISMVSRTLFSIFGEIGADGSEYAASFDFDMDLLEDVLRHAPMHTRQEFVAGLKRMSAFPQTIEFSVAFSIGIEAKLGEPQRGMDETFVPLIVQRVFSAE